MSSRSSKCVSLLHRCFPNLCTSQQQAFLDSLMGRSRFRRLLNQDFTQTINDRMLDRRETFLQGIVDASSSGRLHGQDSLPPTPRSRSIVIDDPLELVTVQDFFKGRRNSDGMSTSSKEEMREILDSKKAQISVRKTAGVMRRKSYGLKLPTTGKPGSP